MIFNYTYFLHCYVHTKCKHNFMNIDFNLIVFYNVVIKYRSGISVRVYKKE